MRKFPLHYLDDKEFENLATLICRKVLGEAVIPFAQGTDGGRDGRFHGKANCFPSESEPWNGKIVIEAKFDKEKGILKKMKDKSEYHLTRRQDYLARVVETTMSLRKHGVPGFIGKNNTTGNNSGSNKQNGNGDDDLDNNNNAEDVEEFNKNDDNL